jgi:tripartite-type tricarboxylate transporter receptor subunit TctC
MLAARASVALGLAALCCGILPAYGQTTPAYPTKPLRFLVGFPPGGFSDLMARAISNKLSETLRQQVIVDNRPGASTSIAADLMAKSAPDGYTILMMTESHVINPSLYRQLPFDAERDFAHVTLGARAPFMLVVHPSLPVKSVKELTAPGRAQQRIGRCGYAWPSRR